MQTGRTEKIGNVVLDYSHYPEQDFYCDGASFARHAGAQALFTVGFSDSAAVPSSVYAAYNAYAGEKQIVDFPGIQPQ